MSRTDNHSAHVLAFNLHELQGCGLDIEVHHDEVPLKAANEWLHENMGAERGFFHEYLGIGLHHAHVIAYHERYCAHGQLFDLSFYQQIYSVPLHPLQEVK
jgi:hypothetical protein